MIRMKCLFIGIFVIIVACSLLIKCDDSEIVDMSRKLDEYLLGIKNERLSRDLEQSGRIWQEYGFDSGTESREELVVTKINTKINNLLFDETQNYKFFIKNGINYLAGSSQSMFVLNILDNKNLNITKQYHLLHSGRIFAFEILNPLDNSDSPRNNDNSQIIVILSAEGTFRRELVGYILSGENFDKFWSWPLDLVDSLHYFQYKNQHRLMALRNQSASIDVYGFTLKSNLSDFWLSERLPGYGVTDLKTCPTYDGIMVALQLRDKIVIYNYANDNSKEGRLVKLTDIKSAGLRNFVCFQTGHILYVGTSGPNAAVYDFYEGEFQLNAIFNQTVENPIEWIEVIPVDTYREEVLLLLQLKNSSTIGVGWNGQSFQFIPSTSFELMDLDLSKITAIPNIGFIYGNRIVEVETTLRELKRPVYDDTESLLQLQYELEEVLRKQQLILEETERRIKTSYLKTSIITGRWQIKNLKSKNVKIEKGIHYKNLLLGGKNTTMDEIESGLDVPNDLLGRFQAILDEIRMRREKALPITASDIKFDGDVEILGDLIVERMADIANLETSSMVMNNITITEMLDLLHFDGNAPIGGHKTFPSIEAKKLNIRTINGIPFENIIFDKHRYEYNGLNFSTINKLNLNGNLNFTNINNHNWQALLSKVISKTKSVAISGETIVNGLVTTSYLNPDKFNGLQYPDDYVIRSDTDSILVTGRKHFKKLHVSSLIVDSTINSSSVDDFILLHRNQTLNKTITFENLEVAGRIQIDGKIIAGPPIEEVFGLLNETQKISTKINFANLIINGKLIINKSINDKTWPMFNDLVSKEKGIVEVSGKKLFSGRVIIAPGVNITSNKINKHDINEFVTFNTNQHFSRLTLIDANVTFGRVERGDLKYLEEIFGLNEEDSIPKCINQVMAFTVPPIVDQLFVDTFNYSTPARDFNTRLNAMSNNFIYKNVNVEKLYVSSLKTDNINGMLYEDFLNRRISKTKKQELTGNYEIKNLDAGMLHAETINGKSAEELEEIKANLDDLYHKIVCGNISINNLSVTGPISAKSLNGKDLSSIYDDSEDMVTVIFESNVTIKNLKIDGLVNRYNLSNIINDAVLKTDRNIVVHGHKNMSHIACEILEASTWNHHSVDRFLNPRLPQNWTGPITVNGTTTVRKIFDISKKIGDVTLGELKNRFDYVSDKIFILRGNFKFPTKNISIDHLFLRGIVQNTNFNMFYESLIFLDSPNISVNSQKIMKNTVTFNDLTVTNRLNDINLEEFYEKVVLIDQPFSINTKVISTKSWQIEGNLILTDEIEVKMVMDVDMSDLIESALYLHDPIFIPGRTIIKNAIFTSDIIVESLNNLTMDNLIPLHRDKIIPGILRGKNVTADNVEIEGTINGQDLNDIYRDTFQLTGNQNILGELMFSADVNIRRDFIVERINGIDPFDFVTLDDNETLTGDFTLKNDAVFNGSLRILGHYNGIDCLTWQAMAVMTKFPYKQIISGQWTIQGDVYLKGNIGSTGVLNGTNIKGLVGEIQKRHSNMSTLIADSAHEFHRICQEVEILKNYASTQIYKFKFFDYLQIFKFNHSITSVHHFESQNSDYLLINLENCQLYKLTFTKGKFIERGSLRDFGVIKHWITLNYGREKYFVTVGENLCYRSRGNIWKWTNNEIVHIMDLGNITDGKKINEHEFFVLSSGGVVLYYSIEDIHKNLREPRKSYFIESKDVKFIANSFDVLLLNNTIIYRFNANFGNFTVSDNVFRTQEVSSFEVGVLRKRIFAYYDETISEDYLFIADIKNSSNYIDQVIYAYRPSSIVLMNFDDFVENFMIFIEDDRWIQIYEYKGVEGFEYRETLQIEADDLLAFEVRKYSEFVKAHCLGIIKDKQFIILEANMYGERLDAEPLKC